MRAAKGVTCASSDGTMPRTITPRMSSPRAMRACAGTKELHPPHRVLARLRGHGMPVGNGATQRVVQLNVGHDRQHAVTHFLLEAVHDRQHDDEGRDPKRNADHRHAGNERNEAVASITAAGAGVTPPDTPFIR